jgi:phosphoribosyl-AMP cyclohydrolase / phosphoribosyl-ATP pyrophosphohydrolase
MSEMNFDEIRFDERGLIPVIVQNAATREVLTLAYMNRESLQRTIETKQTWFWSRSRNELWHKGATSGNTQEVVSLALDCDRDAIVVLVNPAGPACHTGAVSCFDIGTRQDDLGSLLDQLYELIQSRERERPAGSYTTYLFEEGLDKILKKVGEESAETIIAAKNDDGHLTAEVSDLVYHLLVLLVARGVSLAQVAAELGNRRRGQHEKRP